MEVPCWSRLELCLAESLFSIRSCEPVGSPDWSSLLLNPCTPWKGPMLGQFGKSCRPWEGLSLVKYGELSSQGALCAGAGEEHEGDGTPETPGWPEPPFPTPVCCSGRGGGEILTDFDHGKNRGVGGCCFFLALAVSHHPTLFLMGKKLI